MTERATPQLTDVESVLTDLERPGRPNAPEPPKKKARKKKRSIGSRRGVETVFRNAYRAHLDLIALAATKANIMISINGLILSFLFLSEAFSVSSDPLLDIPTGVFLVTCFVSMAFAIMSALPDRRRGDWRPADFAEHRANLLVFEDYTALTEEEYVPAMREALQDSDRIYDSMIRQLYMLGAHANNRMRMLRLSYRVFLIGLGLSILTSFVALMVIYAKEEQTTSASPEVGRFLTVPGLLEPSGLAQLPDGRLLVAGDEEAHALSIFGFAPDGRPTATPLVADGSAANGLGPLDDLEALTTDAAGRVYAVTSHASGRGADDTARHQLVSFRVDGTRITDSAGLDGLAPQLLARIAADLEGSGGPVGIDLEIEGLTVNRSGQQLWLGLRRPLAGERALIAVLENPAATFAGEAPSLSTLSLDLGGGGIRGLAYDGRTDGYLIISRREKPAGEPFRLWHWSGHAADRPLPVTIPGLPDLRRAEAIAPVRLAGEDGILILSDEGRTGGDGRYLLLRYDQLATERGSLAELAVPAEAANRPGRRLLLRPAGRLG